MGTIQHDVMAITHFDWITINRIRSRAKDFFGDSVTPVVKSATNGYLTFFIGPDGSKEGWETSNEYDLKREQFIAYLKDSPAHWVSVSYGELEGQLKESS